jgi:hypothetical protein
MAGFPEINLKHLFIKPDHLAQITGSDVDFFEDVIHNARYCLLR